MASDDQPNHAVQQYKNRRPLYESFTTKLRHLIEELLGSSQIDVASIESRTKSAESFADKIRREGKSYGDPLREVTDLSGLRVITYYLEDVDRIGKIIRQEFMIDEKNSVDKAEVMDPDRFGYLSVHYVVSIHRRRRTLTEWKPFRDLKAEIQVRSVLQHAWATIDHKLTYKAAREVPTTLKRQLFRLSALLELADEEFAQLKGRAEATTKEYVSDIQRGQFDIEVNLDSLDSYLQTSDVATKWTGEAREAKFRKSGQPKRADATNLRDLLEVIQRCGIATIGELDALLREANGWGRNVLTQLKETSSQAGHVPYAQPHDVLAMLVLMAKRDCLREALPAAHFREEIEEAIFQVAGLAE